jgi:hypothetical protein
MAAIAFAIALGVTSMRWGKGEAALTPQKACQVLSVKIGTVNPYINAESNCKPDGKCYNMTADEMKAYIGTPMFVPLEPNHFSCIDGRHDNEVIATPGGDMGLFLSAAETHIKRSTSPSDYSESRLELLLRDFIRKFRSPTNKFYMHTDEHAVHRVHDRLVEEGVDKGVSMDKDKLVSATFDPPAAAKAVLLEALSNMTIGVGCGHIKSMVRLSLRPPSPPTQLLSPTHRHTDT